jgi:hypothetical protein
MHVDTGENAPKKAPVQNGLKECKRTIFSTESKNWRKRMGKMCEYLHVSSRTGHFNWAKPSEESVSTHIEIRNPDGTAKMWCNITTDTEISDCGCQYVVSEIDYFLKRVIYTTGEKNIRAIRDYIIANEDDLTIGNWQQELIAARKKRDKLQERISHLEILIGGMGYFEKGVWVDYAM